MEPYRPPRPVVTALAASVVIVVAAVLATLVARGDEPIPLEARPTGDRPEIHFTPEVAWINDPNGLVKIGDQWHLFYQHNPDDVVWGPMHWGHAVSTDLVDWDELDIAIAPDEIGTIFSGSAVIDEAGVAGFGEGAVVAAFTHFAQPRQMQSIAVSTDGAATFEQLDENPVLQPPSGFRNFRDPRLLRWDRADEPYWIMLVAAGRSIIFYRSDDLASWTPMSTIGPTVGATCGTFETPELFELPLEGSDTTRWVLAVATNNCAPAGGTGVQYFIGDFDGQRFTNENDDDVALWLDHGADFYAPQAFSNVEDRVVWLGWMSNWTYATVVPESGWRGSMSIPREVHLVQTPDGPRLAQVPAAEIDALRRGHDEADGTISGSSDLALEPPRSRAFEVEAHFSWEAGAVQTVAVRLTNVAGEQTEVGYRVPERRTYTDRSESGRVDFHPSFGRAHLGPHEEQARTELTLRLIVDTTSVEAFIDNGTVVFTEQVFPTVPWDRIELVSDGPAEVAATASGLVAS